MNLAFKDRIALHYLLATAALVAVAYLVVFGVVHDRVYTDLDRNLRLEATKHLGELRVTGSTIRFANREEWEEREHLEVQVDPVFVQVNDLHGRLMDR